MTANPLTMAAAINMTRYRKREEQLREQLRRRAQVRANGYTGPLTRAELAEKASRNAS